MKRQILSLIALVLVGIFVIGCTRGGVEEAAAVPPDETMEEAVVNDMENESEIVDNATAEAETGASGDMTTETGTTGGAGTGTTY
ncbi:hypothetical protein HY487_00675 [Candidatus Woesearchaeota archaeon]|nr:hypothetical protein [Candidatus Woesearchaeota archaeon]